MAKIYGGRWETLESLTRGGQAELFKVRDLTQQHPTPCVLKRILNPKRRHRFVSEVSACKKLQHPNIVDLLDHSALEHDESLPEKMFLVMPLLAAGDLEKRVSLYKSSLDSTLQVAEGLVAALEHAHSRGIIHRDVKPANILFSGNNHHPVLSDFGICLLREDKRHTEDGEVVGPRGFIAPELEHGDLASATPSADIYSLGKVIYYMLSGGILLPRESLLEPRHDILSGKGERHLLLARLLDRMICLPERRISSIKEVSDELERIRNWEKESAPLSGMASHLLVNMLADQRTKLSAQEHNAQIATEERKRLEGYKADFERWSNQRIRELTQVLTHEGASTARPLSSSEATKSLHKVERIQFQEHRDRRVAELIGCTGMEFFLNGSLRSDKDRLLLCAYRVLEYRVGFGFHTDQKRELKDQCIIFIPYYFRSDHWQAFFGDKLRTAELNKKVGRSAFELNNFLTTFQEERILSHSSSVGSWPSDRDIYKSVLDRAVEIFLERIHAWSNSSFASLS